MEERRLILAEYFKLYVILNQANRHSNEKTSLEFEFAEDENNKTILYAFLEGSSQKAKIQICHWNELYGWSPSGFSGLNRFEEFCTEIFSKAHENLKIGVRKRPLPDQLIYIKKRLLKSLRELRFDHGA